ncbi:hypothetical protein [Paraburkholderia sp. J8-2]|uniref:hypothetical protein n=1 Tax=Paraburkholderia sp. J8-2 TaxID=2805440 RepID=UPI002AB6861A|nr:hypothetical protein [Paraburkholderia sp. J8-2]
MLVVKEILEETRCRPQWLEFEITEILLLAENDSVMSALLAFEDMGLSIAPRYLSVSCGGKS